MRNRRQNINPQRGGLGDLPASHYAQGRLNDPGAGVSPEWINNYTAANYPFIIGVASELIIPSNPLRVYLLVQNKNAASDMFINFGQAATTFNGEIIIPRGNYEFIGGANGGGFCPKNSIHILGAVAGMEGVITEGILPAVAPR